MAGRGLEAGSDKAKQAGKLAAETRARNKALKGIAPTVKTRGIVVSKLSFKKLEEPNYHKIQIEVPCDIYIHKKFNRMYISPSNTVIRETA